MKFASLNFSLCAAAMLALAPAASALAQTSHQRTENAPPAATPQDAPAGTMQMMPPEMMQMMQMMQKMHGGSFPRMALTGGAFMAPGGVIQNVEGHIAFLKAELKITDAQQKSWDQFADALRANAKELGAASSTMMRGMMGTAGKKITLAVRLEQQEKLLALHLEALKRSRAALERLNAVLSEEQKKQLDELLSPSMPFASGGTSIVSRRG